MAVVMVFFADDDINFQHTSNSAEDAEFDKIVGIMEQILMDPSFNKAQNDFCDLHYGKSCIRHSMSLILFSYF